jgi:hypothetical protein
VSRGGSACVSHKGVNTQLSSQIGVLIYTVASLGIDMDRKLSKRTRRVHKNTRNHLGLYCRALAIWCSVRQRIQRERRPSLVVRVSSISQLLKRNDVVADNADVKIIAINRDNLTVGTILDAELRNTQYRYRLKNRCERVF